MLIAKVFQRKMEYVCASQKRCYFYSGNVFCTSYESRIVAKVFTWRNSLYLARRFFSTFVFVVFISEWMKGTLTKKHLGIKHKTVIMCEIHSYEKKKKIDQYAKELIRIERSSVNFSFGISVKGNGKIGI